MRSQCISCRKLDMHCYTILYHLKLSELVVVSMVSAKGRVFGSKWLLCLVLWQSKRSSARIRMDVVPCIIPWVVSLIYIVTPFVKISQPCGVKSPGHNPPIISLNYRPKTMMVSYNPAQKDKLMGECSTSRVHVQSS